MEAPHVNIIPTVGDRVRVRAGAWTDRATRLGYGLRCGDEGTVLEAFQWAVGPHAGDDAVRVHWARVDAAVIVKPEDLKAVSH
jgi:hypothetical protein